MDAKGITMYESKKREGLRIEIKKSFVWVADCGIIKHDSITAGVSVQYYLFLRNCYSK